MANFWSEGKKDKGKLEEMEDDNLDISCVEGRQGEGAWEGQLAMEEGNQEIQELMLVHK